MEVDFLEETAQRLDKTEWELFQEICECSGISDARRDAWWQGYVQENWIPDLILQACFKICSSTFPEGS